MKKAKACYADGGVIGPDGLTDAQRAKKNAALQGLGMSTTAPAPQQPAIAPVPAPAPQPSATGQGILGILGNRGKQIDKAAGYACGGKVKGHALGGKIEGIGTPTSDSIDASVRETGEQIKVSTGERIVSKAQDKLLQRLAKAMGYESLDAYLEAGTGKPVGPTIKDGKAAAEDGMSPEERDRRLESGNIAGQWIGRSSTPTIGASDQSGEYSNALKTAPSLSGYVNRGDPVKDVATGIANVFSDSAKAARGEDGTYNEIVAARKARESGQVLGSVPGAQATNPAASAAPIPVGGIADIPIGQNYGNEGRSVPQRISKSNPGVVVDNENQFTQGGRTYTSAPTSQQGISRITAPGTSPLYTNIKPEDAVSGLSGKQGNQENVSPDIKERLSNPNAGQVLEKLAQMADRGEMDSTYYGGDGTVKFIPGRPQQSRQNPYSNDNTYDGKGVNDGLARSLGYKDAADFMSSKKAEQQDFLQRRSMMSLEDAVADTKQDETEDWNDKVSGMTPQQIAAKREARRARKAAAYGQMINNETAMRGQELGYASQRAGQGVMIRGQDISALSDKAKLAMLERTDQRHGDEFNLKKRISEGQLADSEAQRSARTAMAAALEKGDTEGYKQAVKQATIAGIKFDGEKSPKFAEIADPNDKSGLRKIPVQYNSDGTYTVMKPAASSGAVSVPKTGEVRDGYRFKGGDPSKQSSWEKI